MKPLAQNSMIQNRYLIVQLIGKGGMGEVYLAVDQRLGSAVALKRTFFKDDSALGSAFEREAKILGRLRHPVLPKVIDHFAENNDQFLVMEHISGDDLAKRLETANKPFPLSWVMFWADQMLDALNYLHSHEPPIVHRDIKPQNLKLTDDNHIVLLDFGLSKDFDSNSASNPLNSASVAGYSPHFASMEQIRGTGTDARSDIYSLSATLYQLMTNTIPADALTRADALLGGLKDPIVPVNEINSEVTPAISDVILKGVSVRQDERFTAATEMQKALRRVFNKGESVAKAQTATSGGVSLPTAAETSAPQPEVSEMVTRTHSGRARMDETLHMDAPPEIEAEVPSELKTAIFSAGDVAEQEATSEPPPIIDVPEPVVEAEIPAVPAAPQVIEEPAPVVEAEIPPVAEQPPVSEEPLAAAAAASTAVSASPPPVRPQAQSKKSSSKAGLFIGGLIGLLVLAAVAGGVGWYAYTNYSSATQSVSPTPAPIAEPSPSATVLVEAAQDVNSNSSESNSNQAATATPDPGDPATGRPQTTTKAAPGRTSQPPAGKAAPKQKAKDDRTVIIQ